MGGRKPTISDREILEFLCQTEDPFLGTSEVAELAGFSTNDGANKRLSDLKDRGLVDSKRAGNSLTWWITDVGREYLESES